VSHSQETGFFKQENKWAHLLGCWVLKRRLRETPTVPELEPFEVVRTLFDVILVAMLLEEKILVTPKGRSCFRARNQPADELFRAAKFFVKLWRTVITKQLEHSSVLWDNRELLVEVVLVPVGPAIGVVGLSFNHEGPVRSLLPPALLIVHSYLHD